MRFYTTLKLGPNREMTPDGFTIFRNVSISRIGEQIYGPNEGTGIEPGDDGLVHIMRTPEEVFRQETMDSANGKSLVLLHPDEDVKPENWRQLTHGFMFNVRRGTGDQSDECVADVFVGSPEILREIDLGQREVSLGYDADYFQTAPGHGEQRNIFINHIASVPSGRCGPQCAVRDHQHNKGACAMKKGAKKSFLDRILDAVKNKDEEAAKKAVEEMDEEAHNGETVEGGNETHVHIHTGPPASQADKEEEPEDPTEKRFKAIEDALKEMKDSRDRSRDGESEEEKKRRESEDAESEEELEEETGSADARKAKDSALLVDSFEAIKSNAEIIAPGIQIPTLDAKADPKKTFRDCHCALRRKALTQGTQDTETASIIAAVRGRVVDAAQIAKMDCSAVRTLFNGVAAMKKNHNNSRLTADAGRTQQTQTTNDTRTPIQKFQDASKKRWSDKK